VSGRVRKPAIAKTPSVSAKRIVQIADAQNVAAHELDPGIGQQAAYRLGGAEREVIEQHDLAGTSGEQRLRDVRADQTRTSRNYEAPPGDIFMSATLGAAATKCQQLTTRRPWMAMGSRAPARRPCNQVVQWLDRREDDFKGGGMANIRPWCMAADTAAGAGNGLTPLAARRRGIEVYTPTLTGLGERAHLLNAAISTSNTHIADVTSRCLNYEDLSDVILVGHSYGGMVITGVADRVRVAGRPPGFPRRGPSSQGRRGTGRDVAGPDGVRAQILAHRRRLRTGDVA
jgi:hypothetical protein